MEHKKELFNGNTLMESHKLGAVICKIMGKPFNWMFIVDLSESMLTCSCSRAMPKFQCKIVGQPLNQYCTTANIENYSRTTKMHVVTFHWKRRNLTLQLKCDHLESCLSSIQNLFDCLIFVFVSHFD